MPNIADIPGAAQLQTQLDTLLRAIDLLGQEGATVPNLTVAPGPQTDPGIFVMPIGVSLSPPISKPETLAAIVSALQAQADDVTQQLVDMGFTDAAPEAPPETGDGEPPKPEWWPEDVPWPPAMPPAIPGRARGPATGPLALRR